MEPGRKESLSPPGRTALVRPFYAPQCSQTAVGWQKICPARPVSGGTGRTPLRRKNAILQTTPDNIVSVFKVLRWNYLQSLATLVATLLRRLAINYSRVHRLLRIITLIRATHDWTASRLARECQVTPRTIFRDMQMLAAAGIPYFFDEEKKCYAIHGDYFMPPVQLTLDESLALVALAERVGRDEQIPYTHAAGKAVDKIRGLLPATIRDELGRLSPYVAIKLASANPPEGAADVYATVRHALSRRRALHCVYESMSKKSNGKPFTLYPYTLMFHQRAWYVVGKHSGYAEPRCLKLNRFTEIKQTDEAYTIPQTFSLDKHLGNAWRMIRGNKSYNVRLRFDAEFAETIADTHWHATQEVDCIGDEIEFRCTVDGLDEIIWWILSMGPHCRVIEPMELVDRVRQLAMQTVDQYAGTLPADGNGVAAGKPSSRT